MAIGKDWTGSFTINPHRRNAVQNYMLKSTQYCLVIVAALMMSNGAWAQQQRQQQQAPAPVNLKFDFGPGKAPEGYTKVPADAVYSNDTGFGFDFNTKPTGVERAGADALHDGLVTSNQPFFFSVKVPTEGNYRITLTLGDAQGESATTVRSESGRMMLPRMMTANGKFETRTIIVNWHTSHLTPPPTNAPGGSEIRMVLANEPSSLHWDDRLTLEFNNSHPCLCAMEIERVDDIPTIFVAGDSTVGDPATGPGGNWPTQLCQWFKPEIAIANHGQGGETLKSFITGLRLDKVLSQMKKGDYFFIQFGHNDQKTSWPQTYAEPGTTYNAYIKAFIAETRRRGATLVLVTPMERQQNQDSVGPWARAMREVAKEENVPLIDQWAMSKDLYSKMGNNSAMFNDQTHPSGYGGYLLSKIVVMGIKQNVPELSKYIVDDFKDLDFVHPDPAPDYLSQPAGRAGARAGGRGARGAATAPGNRGN
jgi:lysophospholipase L1-like esterase